MTMFVVALLPLAVLLAGMVFAVDPILGSSDGCYRCLPVSQIRPRSNVREEFDKASLSRLAESLKKYGQQQPIIVAPDPACPGMFLIVAGERRWRAARLVGIEELECKVLAAFPEDPAELATYQLIENCVREGLVPLDQARAFVRLMEHRHWTASQLAAALHLSDAAVSRALALLRLPDDLAQLVNRQELLPGIAREVARLRSAEEMRAMVAVARDEGLTSEEVRERVSELLKLKTTGRRAGGKAKRRDVIRLEGPWEARVTDKEFSVKFRGPGRSKPRLDQMLEAAEGLVTRLRERLGISEGEVPPGWSHIEPHEDQSPSPRASAALDQSE